MYDSGDIPEDLAHRIFTILEEITGASLQGIVVILETEDAWGTIGACYRKTCGDGKAATPHNMSSGRQFDTIAGFLEHAIGNRGSLN